MSFWEQKNKKTTASSSQQVNQDQLIAKDWKDIHEDFGGHSGRIYKREWKDIGFEFNQTKTLIDAGLDPKEWVFA
ncbi:MAG: hypothetical protein I3270_01675 [Candidatus Moeniiplasma glomeromycotorum]|nr:hypothetical protein [Candidatus Moeniiplasma glomeromycotorum]MCE8162416.1 hypothetical protein [Candidatus Moeniiplasma glomeromycotorum]MCE8166342.1 hypothetical protein [Candidatus Moeniiplasma glomeromycotorum]MCE8166824.1 hypothetical protein [Candidatus Moeniiplasma glomeromycotorum]